MIALSMLLGSVAVACGGDLIPYHRRARVRCGLPPCYEYENRTLSKGMVGESSATLWLQQEGPLPNSTLSATSPGRRLRVWQGGGTALKVGHCSISKVAVWIDENGTWTTSLQAVQDPFIVNGNDRQATPAARFVRNGFHVTIRGYGLAKVADPNRAAQVGQPEMFCIDVPPFWVSRDSTERVSETGMLTMEQRERLPLVDRLEVELRIE
jgi:hypothetical protein